MALGELESNEHVLSAGVVRVLHEFNDRQVGICDQFPSQEPL